jgi:hypothetical protein
MIFSANAQLKDTKCDAHRYDRDQGQRKRFRTASLDAVDILISALAVCRGIVAQLESYHPHVY